MRLRALAGAALLLAVAAPAAHASSEEAKLDFHRVRARDGVGSRRAGGGAAERARRRAARRGRRHVRGCQAVPLRDRAGPAGRGHHRVQVRLDRRNSPPGVHAQIGRAER